MQTVAKTPAPPYYAVIFSSIRTDGDNGYGDAANRMLELASSQPGFLGFETARQEFGISVSYWASLEAIKSWKENAEHRETQKKAKVWYSSLRKFRMLSGISLTRLPDWRIEIFTLTQAYRSVCNSLMATRQTDLTRDKLLRAAFNEIHLHGFQAASIANILRDTGLTKGALYHHFPTKQELGLAVIAEVVSEQLETWIFRRLRESGQPAQTLLKLIDESGRKTEQQALILGCPLNNLMQEMSPLDEEFKIRLNRILSTWQSVIEDTLHREKKSGVVRSDVDCRAAALFIVSAWEGCVGIAKSQQSLKNFSLCMKQLRSYVQNLLVLPAK